MNNPNDIYANTALGSKVLFRNDANGYRSLATATTANGNTAFGTNALLVLTTGINNTAIGYEADVTSGTFGNTTAIGYNAKVGLPFIMRLRPVTYQFDVKRFDGIYTVSYDKAQSVRRSGLIAQEVEEAAEEVNYAFDGMTRPENNRDYYGLSYESFVVPLIRAVQEQQLMMAQLKEDNVSLKQTMQQQKAINELLQEQISKLEELLKEMSRK